MQGVNIWYLTNYKEGEVLAHAIKVLGPNLMLVVKKDFKHEDIYVDDINVFVINLRDMPISEIISIVREDQRLDGFMKFVILNKKDIIKAVNLSFDILHVEFMSKPIRKDEFLLLLEKTIVVERYRAIMKQISGELEMRIETYENMMDIHRKDILVSEEELEAFNKILKYEKRLVQEQSRLNKAIVKFNFLRRKEMFDLQNRIGAEEMIEGLRRKELLDAKCVIQAQESVIDFSTKKLIEANQVIDANEKVVELGRKEAIRLHEEVSKGTKRNNHLSEENKSLRKEIITLKKGMTR